MLHPGTFDFPVISEVVAGAWVRKIVRGEPELESAYVAAAKRLVEKGAVAISSTCGFTIRYQRAVAASVNVPVAMSSLLLLPLLLRQLPARAKIAVLTYDSTCLGEDLLGISNPTERGRVVIGGVEGGQFWQNEMKHPAVLTELADIEMDVAASIARLRAEHPEIAVILFECTAFPQVTTAMRRITELPIYDINTLCQLTFASVR